MDAQSVTFKVSDGNTNIDVWLRIHSDMVEMITRDRHGEVVHEYGREHFEEIIEQYLVNGANVKSEYSDRRESLQELQDSAH